MDFYEVVGQAAKLLQQQGRVTYRSLKWTFGIDDALLGEIREELTLRRLAIDEAEPHYRQALALADDLGMRPLQAHCHRELGILYSQTEQPEQACAELSTALDMYRDMEMTFWLPETEAALAQVEGR